MTTTTTLTAITCFPSLRKRERKKVAAKRSIADQSIESEKLSKQATTTTHISRVKAALKRRSNSNVQHLIHSKYHSPSTSWISRVSIKETFATFKSGQSVKSRINKDMTSKIQIRIVLLKNLSKEEDPLLLQKENVNNNNNSNSNSSVVFPHLLWYFLTIKTPIHINNHKINIEA